MDDLSALDKDLRKNMRDLLRKRGVYVRKDRNVVIAKALYHVIQEELSWRNDDPERPLSTSGHEETMLTCKNSFESKREDTETHDKNDGSESVSFTNDAYNALSPRTSGPD